jgi:uncharacterized protein YbaR (Trm112 family)
VIRSMVNILVCPFDNESQLELFEIKVRFLDNNDLDDLSFVLEKESVEEDKEKGRIKYDKVVSDISRTNAAVSYSNASNRKDGGDNYKDDDNDKDNAIVIVEEGVLFCNDCLRFYPIVDEIPIILPDELRDRARDLDLLGKWSPHLPKKVVEKALPWHL